MANKWIQLQSADGADNLFPVWNMDLLWTNSSPISSFSAQTIQMDLSEYKFLYVIFTYGYNETAFNNQRGSAIAPKGELMGVTILYTNKSYTVYRNFTFNDSGVTFGSAVGDNGQVNAIPYKIFGIK